MAIILEKRFSTPARTWLSALRHGFFPYPTRNRRYLDIRDLPPNLLRDIGVLDGNDPQGRHQ